VEVCFETLTADDISALNGDDWKNARFGVVERSYGMLNELRGSLPEAAPIYRHGVARRQYSGIGRTLVVRLIVESQVQGAAGRLLVRPAQGSGSFYKRLGLVPFTDGKYYIFGRGKSRKCAGSIWGIVMK